jgi:hypothetical protein
MKIDKQPIVIRAGSRIEAIPNNGISSISFITNEDIVARAEGQDEIDVTPLEKIAEDNKEPKKGKKNKSQHGMEA